MNAYLRHIIRFCLGLLAAVASFAPLAAEGHITLAAADASRFLPASPDALIGKTLQDIRSSRLDEALKEVDRVISIRPDFKLAHLIRGDLLMARAKPLSGLGSVPAAPTQSLSDLRDEARMRLMRYIDQPDPTLLPRQILQLARTRNTPCWRMPGAPGFTCSRTSTVNRACCATIT
jgi:hypothetical protein